MSARGLILLGADADALAQAPVSQVMAHWPLDSQPAIHTLTFDEVLGDPALLDGGNAIWLYLNSDEPSTLYDLVASIQDRHIGALISRKDETLALGTAYRSGVICAPPDSPSKVICSMLRTLWNQSDVIRSLKTELRILRAQNGGIASQYDKLDEELRLAAQLQRDMLPKHLPECEGVDLRVFFRPASYVSGDIYDLIQLDDEHIGVFLADAVGHGVPAALMTVFIKRSLRTRRQKGNVREAGEIISPAETLDLLNRDLVSHQTGTVRFATAAYGILNTRTLEFTFARAGHPYPMLLRANGETEWIMPEGGLLGIFPEEKYEQCTLQLNPGDRVVVYSDGFEVAYPSVVQDEGKKTRVANDQYMKEFELLRTGAIDGAFSRFVQKVDLQKGSLNQADDLTALLVGISPDRPAGHRVGGSTSSSSNVAV